MKGARPLIVNPSRKVRVAGEFAGQPQEYEVWTEEWLQRRTGTYQLRWSARIPGRLGSHLGKTARAALASAACVRPNTRPRWLALAAIEAEAKLKPKT